MKASDSIIKIMPDFVKAISEIKAVKKDSKNPFLKNKYASLDAIIESSKPILAVNNLAAVQMVTSLGIETIILHNSGEWISSDFLLIPAEQAKGLSSAQTIGVSITYAKRYQLGGMLGISTDDDTDGAIGDNSHTAEVKATEPKKQLLSDLGLEKAIERAKAGEEGVYEKLVATFELTNIQMRKFETSINSK